MKTGGTFVKESQESQFPARTFTTFSFFLFDDEHLLRRSHKCSRMTIRESHPKFFHKGATLISQSLRRLAQRRDGGDCSGSGAPAPARRELRIARPARGPVA